MVWTTTIGGKTVSVQSDDFGDWVCVMNAEHFGGENPSFSSGTIFPQFPNGETSIRDVRLSGTSGEIKYVDNIQQYSPVFETVDAVRLEGRTENHDRKIHYYTTNQTVIDSIVYNNTKANHTALASNVTKYPDHSAGLPDSSADRNFTDSRTDKIFGYGFPMYGNMDGVSGNEHWALGGNGNRWEMDDYPNNASQTTIHRVWVRIPDGLPLPSTVKRTTDDEVLKT